MRSKDSELLRQVKDFIEEFCDDNGHGPTVREVAYEFRRSVGWAQKYLAQLAADRQLTRGRRGYESNALSRTNKAMCTIPILGAVPCGPLTEVEEAIEGYVRLPESFVGSGDYYFLTASGDSMIEAGIADGDMVLIRSTEEAHPGSIVVALVENEVTLKTLMRDDDGTVYLHPENKAMADIYADSIQIQGVAVKALKDLE